MNLFCSRPAGCQAGSRDRRKTFSLPCGAAIPLVFTILLAVPRPGAAGTNRYDVPGNDVVIYNLVGELRVEPGSGKQVSVDVTTEGADAGRLRVETGEKDGHPGLRVIYPGDRFFYDRMNKHSSTTVELRDDGTFGGTHGGRRVKISGGSGLDAHADVTVLVPANQTVTVHLGIGQVKASRVNATLRIDTIGAPVHAEGMRGALNIDVGSGSVEVVGMDGSLQVDTGSGGVDISHVDGDRIHVDTGSGGVSGSDLAADMVYVDTGSGGIELASIDAPDIRLDTGSGSVSVDLLEDVDRLSIDTGSGGVSIGVPDNLGAEVRVETGSGGIDIAVPHQAVRSRRSSFQGSIGDGKGRIVVETGSGSVQIVKAVGPRP